MCHIQCASCMLSCFSHVPLCTTLWTAAHQAPLYMGFSRQENWSGLPCPSSKGSNPHLLHIPALANGFFTSSTTWKAHHIQYVCI